MAIVKAIIGVLLIIAGAFFTFKPKLNYAREGLSDMFAIIGIILMVAGVVLILSPFLQ
ncbi:MAG TPA: hypothetical protein PKN36_01345 [bacterium]|nr:hypothetical protein [bacterium]